MKPDKNIDDLFSMVATEGLVLYYQGISGHNAVRAPMCFQMFMG